MSHKKHKEHYADANKLLNAQSQPSDSELLDLLRAVGHHGINIGEGIFEIDSSHVAEAQRLYRKLQSLGSAIVEQGGQFIQDSQ